MLWYIYVVPHEIPPPTDMITTEALAVDAVDAPEPISEHPDTPGPQTLTQHAAARGLSEQYEAAVRIVTSPNFAQQVGRAATEYMYRHNLASTTDLDDIRQEVALRLLRSPGMLQTDGHSLASSALAKATRWAILNEWRKTTGRGIRAPLQFLDGSVDYSDGPDTFAAFGDHRPALEPDFSEAADQRLAFERALLLLSPKHQEIIRLIYYEDLIFIDASRRLNIPTSTAKQRAYEAVYQLGCILMEQGAL